MTGSAVLGVLAVGSLASWCDLRTRRIPNWLTFGGAIAGALHQLATSGGAGLASAAAGWAIGLGLFLPLYLLRGMGAGDVKLLAAFGAWLGFALVWWVAIYGAIVGGLLAIPLLVARRAVGRTAQNLWALVGFWRLVGIRPYPGLTLDSPEAIRLPYALPLAIGAGLTLWLRT